MRLIVHDLPWDAWAALRGLLCDGSAVVTSGPETPFCIGCFGCWVKTPGVCVLPGDISEMGKRLARAQELCIISRCAYGGYSPPVKTVIDRSIPYIHPFFTVRGGEMHHKRRHPNAISIRVFFYGDATEGERETARRLVAANALNLCARDHEVAFVPDIHALREVLS